jgi:hypothetical protein
LDDPAPGWRRTVRAQDAVAELMLEAMAEEPLASL